MIEGAPRVQSVGRRQELKRNKNSSVSSAREIAGGVIGVVVGLGLIAISRERTADLRSLPQPGAGTTARVDETPMMQILLFLGILMLIAGLFYAIRGVRRLVQEKRP